MRENLIEKTIDYVKGKLQEAEGGHDWFHTERVYKMARRIALVEQVDLQIVSLAALLHDVADPKFHDGDESIGPRLAQSFLNEQGVDIDDIDHVVNIIGHMSFKNSFDRPSFSSAEMKVVQDADRLDAIGAIGIARAFSYGGFKKRKLYDPDTPANLNMTKAEYKASKSPTINHFYEKLLLLKDGLNTPTARKIAEQRHQYMEEFLVQFFAEWDAKR